MHPDVERSLPALRRRYGEAAVARQLEALEGHGDAVDDPALWLELALRLDFKGMPIERAAACACGAADSAPLARFVFWNLLGLRRCRACGLVFVSPRLTPEAIGRIFSEEYFDPADLEHWGTRRRPVFAEIGAILRAHGARRVLDVGAAYGHFVRWARDAGLEALGCDISETAVRVGRERLGVDLREGGVGDLALEAPVDAVVSLDTLYYARDPAADLRAMWRLTSPDGLLVLRLRNGVWTRARVALARPGAMLDFPLPAAHLWSFTPATASALLEANGWRVEGCTPAAASVTRLHPLEQLPSALNRLARRLGGVAPVLTRSFLLVARRASVLADAPRTGARIAAPDAIPPGPVSPSASVN